MKGYRQILFIGLFLIVALIGCSKEKTDLEIQATIGYDNVVKVSKGNPLEVTVQNFGGDIEGYIRTYYDVNGNQKVEMDKEIQIAGNTTKVFRLYLPVYRIQKSFDVELVVGNDVVASTTAKPTQTIAPYQSTMGILSDYPDDYRYLNDMEWMIPEGIQQEQDTFRNNYYQSTMDETNQEEDNRLKAIFLEEIEPLKDSEGMGFFSALMIGQTDALRDQEEAAHTLYDWVNNGGILFAERETILPDSLDTIVWGASESMEPLSDNEQRFSGEVSYALATDMDDSTKAIYVAGIPVAYDTAIGSGHIIRLAVDLKQAPISDWNRNGYFFESLIQSLELRTASKYYFDDYANWYDLENLPSEKRPPFGVMGVILFFYILVVGPLSYFVLKRKDKREWMWITIPAISLLSIVIIYLVGFSSRYDKPIENSISYITQQQGTNYMDVQSTIGIFNNKQGDMTIDWNKNEAIQAMLEDSSYYDDQKVEKKKVIGRHVDGERNRYIQSDVGVWSLVRLSGSKAIPLEDTSNQEVTVKVLDGEIGFEVTNRLPLDIDYAFLIWGNTVYPLGNFESGETTTVHEQKNMDDYFRNEVFQGRMYSSGEIQGMSASETYEAYFANDELTNWYRNQQYYDSSQDRAFIVGVNQTPIGYDIIANGDEPDVYNRNVILVEYGVDFGENQELGTIDFGVIQPSLDNTQGYMDYSDTLQEERVAIYHAETGAYEMSYKLMAGYKVEDIVLKTRPVVEQDNFYSSDRKFRDAQGIEASLNVYNPISNEWEVLTDYMLSEEFEIDPNTYIGEDGTVRLQLVIPEDEEWNSYIVGLPQIGLNMGGIDND